MGTWPTAILKAAHFQPFFIKMWSVINQLYTQLKDLLSVICVATGVRQRMICINTQQLTQKGPSSAIFVLLLQKEKEAL